MMSNNLEEYADPDLYDLENQAFEPDGPFYQTLAQRIGGRVLDIGCGTGRITIPLAQAGFDITGLDITPKMLERARTKAGSLPIRWVEADARQFDLGTTFGVIIESGAAFQHLLTRADQEAMLTRVKEHLEPDGRFIVVLRFPKNSDVITDEIEREWFSYFTVQGFEVTVSGTQHYDPLRQVKTETAYRRWNDAGGRKVVRVAPLMLRYTFPQEMETLLHYNDFDIVERYGDLHFGALTSESKYLIYVCAKRV